MLARTKVRCLATVMDSARVRQVLRGTTSPGNRDPRQSHSSGLRPVFVHIRTDCWLFFCENRVPWVL